MFDHDGDGRLTASGWVGAGEAIVVRDLNGNGSIDAGRELFGDNTVLKNGRNAANGFEALADLDSNEDGQFNAADAEFSTVKLWKDANQNGTSEAGELYSFAQLGVEGIGVAASWDNTGLTDARGADTGNVQTQVGSFTWAEGTAGQPGAAGLAADLMLANNNFYSEFTDDPAITAEARALPQMQGSGLVRDLREAMSLGTAQALELSQKLATYAADTTRAQQLSHVDALIQSWGATSAMPTSIQTNRATNPGATASVIEQFAQNNPCIYAKITALEQFNGTTILEKWVSGQSTSWSVSYSSEQGAFIDQAYDALKTSVYGALAMQTRLKPYLDSIGLVVDESGVHFDTTALSGKLNLLKTTDFASAATDLMDLNRYGQTTLESVGFDGKQLLSNWLGAIDKTSVLNEIDWSASNTVSQGADYYLGSKSNDTISGQSGDDFIWGGDGNDTLDGGDGADTLQGGLGNDVLDGGYGDDTLDGGAGDDTYMVDSANDTVFESLDGGTDTVQSSVSYTLGATLEHLTLTGESDIDGTGNALANVVTGNSAANVLTGGAGNDTLNGGYGNDTYVFNQGDGADTINEDYSWWTENNLNTLKLGAGLTATAAAVSLMGSDLTLTWGGDSVTLKNCFSGNFYQVETIDFADGTRWSVADVAARLVQNGTDDADYLYGLSDYANRMNGLGGDDYLVGGNQADEISGGAGHDLLVGGHGDDVLNGGTGEDFLAGGTGNDLYVVDSATDLIAENAWEGTDTVQSAVTYTLGSELENLTLTGTARINGTGNALNNVLTGNTGANVLNGGAGVDTLIGGAGNDIYIVDSTTDTITENLNGGTDTVRSSVGYTLGNNLENLTLAGAATINGTGNALNNSLVGNSAANTLSGGAGNDTLDGGAGADVLLGGAGNDTYRVGRGTGAETVQENDSTAGNRDVLSFMAGISREQLWFRKVSDSLEVSIIGSTDKVTVSDWYLGDAHHVEQFKTSDGKTLLDSQVQNLVNAMAAFAPPAAGQTTLPAAYASALTPVLAANWQ